MDTLSKMTKAELVKHAQAQGAEIERLRAEVAKAGAPKPTKAAYVPRPPSPEQLARREAMQRAKEAAMAGGKSVVAQF